MSIDSKNKELRERLARMNSAARRPMTRAQRRALMRQRGIPIGVDAQGAPVFIRLPDLHRHGLIAGSSGTGKSMLNYLLFGCLIIAGAIVIIVDGKGPLYHDLVNLCWHLRKPLHELVLVNPRDRRWLPAINRLQLRHGRTPENLGKAVHEQLKKVFGDKEPRPWLEEWLPVCLATLAAANLTLAELYPFARLADPRFRHAVLAAVGDKLSRFYRDKWADLELLAPHEASIVTGALRTRGSFVWGSRSLLPILGQRESTVDFARIMRTPGSVVLVNAGLHEDLTEDQSRLLGTSVIQEVADAAWSRQGEPDLPHVYVGIDEARKFVTPDLSSAFEIMRGLNVHFVISNQSLSQLQQEDEFTADNIIANSAVKLIFGTSRADAELLARELWSGHLDFKTVKDEIYQTKFKPVESTRIIESSSCSESSGSSDSDGWGEASNMGSSWDQDGITESSGLGASFTHGSGSTSSSSSSSSTVEVPFMEAHPFLEMTGRSFYSVEELWEQAMGAITGQKVQHAVLGVHGQAPRAIVTPHVSPLTVPDHLLTPYLEALYQRHGRPTAEVLAEIESRVDQFIAEYGSRAQPDGFEESHYYEDLGRKGTEDER